MLARPLFAACAQPAMFKQAFQRAASTSTRRAASKPLLFAGAGGAAIALAPIRLPIRCEPATTSAARPYAEPHTPAVQGPGSSRIAPRNDLPPVESSLDLRSLSFGAVAGISTGIFVKKGLKAVGFLLGGAFVFLQYMAARGMVNVDWKSMARRYEGTVDTFAGAGTGSRLQRVGGRVMDFLLADFPPRATFAAGLALGLRLG